jgi:hypothetical protein
MNLHLCIPYQSRLALIKSSFTTFLTRNEDGVGGKSRFLPLVGNTQLKIGTRREHQVRLVSSPNEDCYGNSPTMLAQLETTEGTNEPWGHHLVADCVGIPA